MMPGPCLLAGREILVADDNHMVCRLLVRMLAGLGCMKVTEARDGAHAMELLQDGCRPDVLIVDHDMPRMDGGELIRTIRRGEARIHPDIPIVLVTGFPDGWRIVEGREAGANEILVKPFSAEALGQRLSRCLEDPEQRSP